MCILRTTQVVSDDTGSCCLIDFGLSYVSGMPEDKVIICFCEGFWSDNVTVGNVPPCCSSRGKISIIQMRPPRTVGVTDTCMRFKQIRPDIELPNIFI